MIIVIPQAAREGLAIGAVLLAAMALAGAGLLLLCWQGRRGV